MTRKVDKNNVVQSREHKPSFYATSSQPIQPAADGEVKFLEQEFHDLKNQINAIDSRIIKIEKWLWWGTLIAVILIGVMAITNPQVVMFLKKIHL